MNLQSTIDVYAGGSGSGCAGSNCGRKKKRFITVVPRVKGKLYKAGELAEVPFNKLRKNPFQFGISEDRVKMYERKIKSGKGGVPAVSVDRHTMTILDGHHRARAYANLGRKVVVRFE